MINILLLDLVTFVRLILIRIFILAFCVLQFTTISCKASFVLGPLMQYFTQIHLHQRWRVSDVCDSRVIRAYHGHREITNRKRSQPGLELDCALIRQNKLQVCIIHGSRASYGVLFLSRRSQSVQFNATVLKRMVSTF